MGRVFRATLWLLALGIHAPGHAASLSLCPNAPWREAADQVFDATGNPVTLAVADQPAPAPCQVLTLPAAAEQVRWVALADVLPGEPAPRSVALQGRFENTPPAISDVLHVNARRVEPSYLPFGANALAGFDGVPFGSEERARYTSDGQLECEAGSRPAGVVLQAANRQWPPLAVSELVVDGSGNGAFEVGIADAQRQANGTPLSLGTVEVNAGSPPASWNFAVPSNSAPWQSLTVLCPTAAASLQLQALTLHHAAATAAPPGRAAWVWAPQHWRQQPEQVWQLASDHALRKLFITVPVSAAGEVENAEALRSFLRTAHQRGVEIWAVIGDRSDVLPEHREALLKRAEAYRTFNSATSQPAARLDGLQLDIEPYLLPGAALAYPVWRERYLATISSVHGALAGQLPLDLVMPVWWGTHAGWGSALLAGLPRKALSVTVMNYRTAAAQLVEGALPFLAWGLEQQVPVAMALETGRVGVSGGGTGNSSGETRRYFGATAEAGALWLLTLDGAAVWVLFSEPVAGLPGQAYALGDEIPLGSSGVTFAEQPAPFEVIAEAMVREWSAWPSFGGLAIHGLDELLPVTP